MAGVGVKLNGNLLDKGRTRTVPFDDHTLNSCARKPNVGRTPTCTSPIFHPPPPPPPPAPVARHVHNPLRASKRPSFGLRYDENERNH